MANLITVRLNKGDSPSWGFRLQGGKDFGAPLVIQKVNVGSPAERAGLIAGDCVIKVNNTDVFNLRHKDAQDVIVRAGNSFEVTVQRGSTWKPAVIPTGTLSSPKPTAPINNISPVTKTSLAAPKSDNWGSVGTGHNLSAKPFAGAAVNGVGPKLVNKQYNSPVNLYSEDTIAETLSAQAEVLANGVLGVNFKKNEKTYDASKSNVLRYVKEDELEPKSPEPAHDTVDSGVVSTPSPLGVAGLRHVKAPENKPAPTNPSLPPGQNICADCERLIVGVFVRIKDKNLHVECFKCSTCGTSLKNVGYYNINSKLYCDVHAKLAAKANPATPNLTPVTAPISGRPIGGVSSISPNSLPSSAPLSPNINSYAPPPFQSHGPNAGYICVRSNAPNLIKSSLNSAAASRKRNVTNGISNPIKTNTFSPRIEENTKNISKINVRSGQNNFGGPRPFSNSSGPLSPSGQHYSTLPKPTSTPLSSGRNSSLNIVWPPPPPEESEVPLACPIYIPPPSHVKIKPIDPSHLINKAQKSSQNKKIVEENGNLQPISKEHNNYQHYCNLSEFSEYGDYLEEMSYISGNIDQYSSHYSDTSSISGRKSTQECVELLSEVIDNQRLAENFKRSQPIFLESEGHIDEHQQPMWEAKSMLKQTPQSLKIETQTMEKSKSKNELSSEVISVNKEEKKEIISSRTEECPSACSIKLNRYQKKIENSVPHEYESPMVLALTVASDKPFSQMQVEITKSGVTKLDQVSQEVTSSEQFALSSSAEKMTSQIEQTTSTKVEERSELSSQTTNVKDEISNYGSFTIPEKISTSALANALVTAPSEPFGLTQTTNEPVSLPEETQPYFPPSDLFAVKISSKSEEEIKKSEKLSRFRKKKDSLEDIFKDLPKPTQKLDLLSALTTAPDRPFSPLPFKVEEETGEERQEKELKSDENSQKDEIKKSDELLKPSVPKTFKTEISHDIVQTVGDSKRCKDQYSSKLKSETQEAMETGKEKKLKTKSLKKEVSKKEASVEKSTQKFKDKNGSILFKEQQIDYTTKVENKENIIHEEKKESKLKILQESDGNRIKKEKLEAETSNQLLKENNTKISKIPKPRDVKSISHDGNFKTSVVDEKVIEEYHKAFSSEQKILQTPTKIPVAAIKQTEPKQVETPKVIFQPIIDEKPQSRSFSPRPGSLTPSMINKTPPLIPAYQAMLVPTECLAAHSIVFDPKSPGVSRTPSPGPGKCSALSGRLSPFPGKTSTRPISPAVGPPSNPMDIIHPKPKPDPEVIEAKKKIANTFQQSTEEKVKQVKAAKYALEKVSSDAVSHGDLHQSQKRNIKETSQSYVAQLAEEQRVQEEMKSQLESVEISKEGHVQVQRKKKVVEEFEHSQKSKNVQIEKSTLTTKSRVVGDDCQVGVSGMHVTNPQPLKSPFLPKSETTDKEVIKNNDKVTKSECKLEDGCCKKLPDNKSCTPTPSSNIPKLIRTQSFPTSGSSPKPYVPPPLSSDIVTRPNVSLPNTGTTSGRQVGAVGVSPKRGRGVLNVGGGSRVPLCGHCHKNIRGPFVTALGKIWCPEHFSCATPSCRRPLQDLGFVEEQGQLYCEYCFERYLAPPCAKCGAKIKAECLKAIGKHFHPECFNCVYCGKLFGNNPFFLEDGEPYCESDWNELFTTKCFACGFPIEAGDRWVEALSNNYHSQCFNCTMCKKNLEGQSFFAKGGRPFCKNHAR